MRAVLAIAILLTLGGAAFAKPAPPANPRLTPSPADLAIAVGAAGALVESDYFRAPARYSGHRPLMCSLQMELFSKIRLARACH